MPAVTQTPPEPAPRRHQTRQRARILAWLRATDSHPTALQTHEALVRELPNLSLGTVYRNLEVLVSEGAIDEVASAGTGVRYDGNPKPHHHFICESCGAIDDLHLQAPPSSRASCAARAAGPPGASASISTVSARRVSCTARRQRPDARTRPRRRHA